MDLSVIVTLMGGLGLFLLGMHQMGDGMEKAAGARMRNILEAVTSNRVMGTLVGILFCAVIQSSSATTVMVVSFVNAGMMKLAQALPVIFGANIGSTATAQILRLGDLEGAGILLKLLKPSSFAPIIIAIGAGIMLMAKKKKTKNIANLLLGFGILLPRLFRVPRPPSVSCRHFLLLVRLPSPWHSR